MQKKLRLYSYHGTKFIYFEHSLRADETIYWKKEVKCLPNSHHNSLNLRIRNDPILEDWQEIRNMIWSTKSVAKITQQTR
jgi:hypothetical protein